jgi:YD repeat-containing protein
LEPGPVRDGVAMVDEKNTGFAPQTGLFVVRHAFEPANPEKPVCKQMGAAGELVQQWHQEGTAAGLHGVLYDNHDGDHSNLDYGKFPQLTRVEYAEPARQRGLHLGLQQWFAHNAPVLGNSSMAATGGPFWGSMPRLALRQPRLAGIQFQHYTNNHLYFYPEHRDHDSDGFGDVYPANTPYTIISQVSSGSDRPFLHAAALALAALSPGTQQAAFQSKRMAPTLQMILRRSLKDIATDDDYLTGRAHPTAFDAARLDVERMVRLAHDLSPDELPPVALLQVTDEDSSEPGIDYFDAGPAEKLLETPCAVARVARATRCRRRMVVRAVAVPASARPTTWHWKLLRGDPERVALKPSPDGQECEIVVAWHERRAIEEGSSLSSCRVDVGLFASQGKYISAPSFVSWLFPGNEERVYRDGRIESVEYFAGDKPDRYVDPAIITPAVWRDEYRYDPQGRLLGWMRLRDGQTEEFTRHGALVQTKDERGRPLQACTVRYRRRQDSATSRPRLIQEPGDEVLTYSYSSPVDLMGETQSRPAGKPGEEPQGTR